MLRRRIYVVNPCAPEFKCGDGACSVNGFCAGGSGGGEEEEYVPEPPVLTLVGPARVTVEMGTAYTM